MTLLRTFAFCASLALAAPGLGQGTPENPGYLSFHFTSPHTPFPDTGRVQGHLGDGVFYPMKGHYDDSTVLVVVPKGFRPGHRIDFVFWFHGWHNNVDTALEFYGLATQFAASRRNAVLVLAEAAKNAADSYAGKLRQKGMFRSLVGDVMTQLKERRIVPRRAETGAVVLAGHSGAFLAIADILEDGEMPVREVFLFDALYSHVEQFMGWIAQDPGHHFVHWFTNHGGGTDAMSDTMMLRLRDAGIAYRLVEEADVTPAAIRSNRVLFVHSLREHNVIINHPDDFLLLLQNSWYLKKD